MSECSANYTRQYWNVSDNTHRKGYIRDYPRKYHGVALVECCLKKEIMKRTLIDQELNLLYRYGLDKFRTMREKILPEHMTEFMEENEEDDYFDEDGN